MWGCLQSFLKPLPQKELQERKGLNPARTATAPKMIKVFLQTLPFLSHPSRRKQAGGTYRNTPLHQGQQMTTGYAVALDSSRPDKNDSVASDGGVL